MNKFKIIAALTLITACLSNALPPIQWDLTNMQNVTVEENKVTMISGGVWEGGIISKNKLNPGEDGSVQTTVTTICNKMIGLSPYNTSPVYSSIKYALYLKGSAIEIYALGWRAISGGVAIGDVFKVSREGSKVIFYKNNASIFILDIGGSSETLFCDVSLFQGGNTIENVSASFGNLGLTGPVSGTYKPTGSISKIYWDAVATTTSVNLDYSKDCGATWSAIAHGIARGSNWGEYT